jgi:NDP-sugar pyrophosphorylase family protein
MSKQEIIMEGPILVVLAAGMGSRYGGLKQMDRLGEHGEVLLDFSVFDALRSGFKKIVFIIRHDLEADFEKYILGRMKGINCDIAYQELSSLIPSDIIVESRRAGRTKPWGTAHAILCAEKKINAPFAVINADDFYGREAFDSMGKYLANPAGGEGAIVPYRLENVLSSKGTVTRGVCEIRGEYLVSVDELMAIEKAGDVIINTDPTGLKSELSPATPVSMNFWGFPVTIFPALKEYFENFLQESGRDPKSECYMPRAADWLIKIGVLKIRVLHADSEWFGITYREDRDFAVNRIADMVRQGIYPSPLW